MPSAPDHQHLKQDDDSDPATARAAAEAVLCRAERAHLSSSVSLGERQSPRAGAGAGAGAGSGAGGAHVTTNHSAESIDSAANAPMAPEHSRRRHRCDASAIVTVMKDENRTKIDFVREIQALYVQGKITKGEFLVMKASHRRYQGTQQEDEIGDDAGTSSPRDKFGDDGARRQTETLDDEYAMPWDLEIERLHEEGNISDKEYRHMGETYLRLRQLQQEVDTANFVYDSLNDHENANAQTNVEISTNNPEIEKLYRRGAISAEEYAHLKESHRRLKRELEGDDRGSSARAADGNVMVKT